MHVHVHSENGEAKFWMESEIELAQNHGLREREINQARCLIEEHEDEIRSAWRVHFGG